MLHEDNNAISNKHVCCEFAQSLLV